MFSMTWKKTKNCLNFLTLKASKISTRPLKTETLDMYFCLKVIIQLKSYVTHKNVKFVASNILEEWHLLKYINYFDIYTNNKEITYIS